MNENKENILINSAEYWNGRFEENWETMLGAEQTVFFAEIALKLLPSWLKMEITSEKLSICDFGCALGQAVDVLHTSLKTEVCGVDFSEQAITAAQSRFSQYKFVKKDIVNDDMSDISFDIGYVSNVLEHIPDPWRTAKNISQCISRYLIIMIPFRESLNIDEHCNKFVPANIPVILGELKLIYANCKDCTDLEETLYPDKQILLVYSKNFKAVEKVSLNDYIESFEAEYQLLKDKNQRILELEEELGACRNGMKSLTAEKQRLEQEKIHMQNELQNKEHMLSEKESLLSASERKIISLENSIRSAVQTCNSLDSWGLYKFSHFLHRTRHQFIQGGLDEKKKYMKWLYNYLKGRGTDSETKYKPVHKIAEILSSAWMTETQNTENRYEQFNSILSQPYTRFDVIILGVIDYDFRFQRPQQLAVRYAENGHRVFYFNANHYKEPSVYQTGENLYVIDIHSDSFTAIYLTDWEQQLDSVKKQFKNILDSYCIRDAVTIVDYPNWIHVAQMLRKEYGFKIITDYMDDYTGFLNPAEDLVRSNCEKLLETSDQVIASSQFLSDIACKFNEHVEIVRNGTEFDHFHKAYGVREGGKIIGYYGAVAEWFDVDKVVYLAKSLPEYEIRIIGDVTSGKNKLKKCPNICLMGEKPYSELPVYLKTFDVCLIPFDTSTDLIKATNPVKFYEYLSAGKKIVATEIPELLPFKDKYVYMSNDNDKFLEYVKLCLSGKDTLEDDEAKMDLARSNDWQKRYEKFMILSKECVPKISIVILTYNNLEFNKLCLHSILNTTAYPNYEIIVVDNHSTDGTRAYLENIRSGYPSVKVVLNNENKGFAAGNNDGMKKAEGDYIVLLNNDTVVTRGWLTAMCKHLENDPELGMCGPVTNSIGNEAQIAVTYHSLSELSQFSYNYTTAHLSEEYRDVKVLALFCTMIKKQIIDTYGYLDEGYGIGMFEDDDYSEMVKSKGFRITIAEDAFIHHFHGVSFKKLEDERFKKIFQYNKELFERKWNRKWTGHKMRAGVDGMTNLDNLINLSEEKWKDS